MTNTSTNQPYLTVRDLIEMLSDPSVDKDLKVSFRAAPGDNHGFVGGFKRKEFISNHGPGGISSVRIQTLELHP